MHSSCRGLLVGLLVLCVTLPGFASGLDTVWVSSLDISKVRQSWGTPQADRSVMKKRLSVAGQIYERGLGTHSSSIAWFDLAGAAETFCASVGVDDSSGGGGSVRFKVIGDGNTLFQSGVVRSGQKAAPVNVDVRRVQKLVLAVNDAADGNSFDHADWCDARLLMTRGASPLAIDAPRDQAVILTPSAPPAPRIHGPVRYGSRPGNPFLYRIPTTGSRPITFSVNHLPSSLVLDGNAGIIRGTTPARGEYTITLQAKNQHGSASRTFTLVSGDVLALTPPMGWNHWYAHYGRITDAMIREAADEMVRSGMADVGYQYVDIDDCWMNAPRNDDSMRVGPLRDTRGSIVPNKYFPDMKGLTAYIHEKGLRAGLYTSPGKLTCAGFAGSYQHEAQDARQFADWGFDFLKYDWCSYGEVAAGDNSRAALMKPYDLMGSLLKEQKRDIVLNLCQYGMGNVWEWGAAIGGHCWRTAGDLGYELDRVFDVALKNAEHRAWSRPGAWNDPDYIQIGYFGDARKGGLPVQCAMGPNEQYAYMSLWCLMASPLFFSGDMTRLDPFTLNILCNPEVLDVDQDPLGQSAAVAHLNDETFLMVKDLSDGGKAVGLFNRGEFPAEVVAPWAVIGISGKHTVRDVWRQEDLGVFDDAFRSTVPRHGVVLVRMSAGSAPASARERKARGTHPSTIAIPNQRPLTN
jgi:alpha-galactosidase